METKWVQVNPEAYTFAADLEKPQYVDPPKEDPLIEAAKLLADKEVVAVPTETVYGLAGNAFCETSVRKIFEVKNRPADNPLIVHVSSLEMLRSLLPEGKIPEVYTEVIRKFWPGPLTILLPCSELIPSVVTCNQPTVAIRFPSHPVARALIDLCGFPLAAPSANSSGKPSPTLAKHVYKDLNGKIPFIIDGGQCDVGLESTVLDALRNPPVILRPGGVTYEELVKIPGYSDLKVYKKDFVDKALEMVPTTPGMKYRHYSPEAEVVLFESETDAMEHNTKLAAMQEEIKALEKLGKSKFGILRTTPIGAQPTHYGDMEYVELPMGDARQPDLVAKELFKAFRYLDEMNVDSILVEGIAESDEGLAVMNRLRKAASRIIKC
ncbi:translation factor [Basidiobolus meristosporus CBS 931.73]|uniref:Threonylcarbamoyl-AMP synthase n=1 Tax=Basidiobolus meristosporus CBS 931.73 TaxID=1314790 RepID=A0A1Y1YEH9_9FUNG|nr:translation factor [Basidiobolus meristosporus CBS 931.73]|eukprot:ORX96333.1 translation factor [Basidiobolus meristosporus CBS 931.73]